jgi:DNA-binding CsgD family transcriptional regulator/predicted enzyme related to lactoylglutathione lyase
MTRRPRGRPRHPDVLTPAEWGVLDMLRHGMTRREIARRRGISLDAIKYHVENIGGKLGVTGTTALRHWPGYPVSSPLASRSVPMPDSDLALGPIGQVSLLARDIARVEAFYRDTLGLPHVFTFGDLAFFDASGTRIYLRSVPEEEWRPSSVLYFTVDDIRSAFATLEARSVHTIGAPHLIHRHADSGIEEWMAFFEDTEGNTLAIMSRVPPEPNG